MPHFELLLPYKIHLFMPEAQATETQGESQTATPATTEEPPPTIETLEVGVSGTSGLTAVTPNSFLFTGAAVSNIPIEVPPGRNRRGLSQS
jgi:hypothetical protein